MLTSRESREGVTCRDEGCAGVKLRFSSASLTEPFQAILGKEVGNSIPSPF